MKAEHDRYTRRAVLAAGMALALVPRSLQAGTSSSVTAPGDKAMRITCEFSGRVFTATLLDNPSARDFASMLPLALTIEDYADNEKIAYLPRKLSEEGSAPYSGEQPGDLCYYAPWGNLVFFYDSYRYSSGLIRLGRVDDGIKPLLMKGKFPLRIEHT